ncbi:acyltransferase domain-containing protein [Streptomyces gilvus]|uniref:acyltransferase domain-containing protein n=1 Tax=Streptomyces gilvus TaxID=2920937 RepID=UPI001F0E8B33|nr:acyltransferase domain-containing protein [Streptomyces sp. CME 23]MCH5670841.1 acyltransferase domain-containing protein [Streptomyces sp. CME 23]
MSGPMLLAWSARDERAEPRLRRKILDELARHPGHSERLDRLLDDHRDPDLPVRGVAVVNGADPTDPTDPTDQALAAVRDAAVRTVARHGPPRPVALMLDGHGAQHVRMGAQLYGAEPEFTRWMDHVFAAFGAHGGVLRTDWLAEHPVIPVDAAERGQPLLFALGYALARTVESWGVRPAALVGHSVGELAAAAVAGVIDPADAASLLAARGAAYRDAVPGGLLAVAAPAGQLTKFLDGEVCVGVVNGPHQTMLAGTEEGLDSVAPRLKAAGYTAIRARIPLPFHSPLLAPLAETSQAALARTVLRPPGTDVYSTITARRLRPEEATDPAFWSAQVCRPVLFGPALDALLSERDVLLIEAGPGRMLTNLARRHAAVVEGRSAVAAMLPQRQGGPGADRRALLDAAAACWLEGHPLDWRAVSVRGDVSHSGRRQGAVPPTGDSRDVPA